jgi:hypothetical protein
MKSFSGFPEGKVQFTSIPDQFFHSLLPLIDHLGELKTTLYAFWYLDHMEGVFRYLRPQRILDPLFATKYLLEGNLRIRERCRRFLFSEYAQR